MSKDALILTLIGTAIIAALLSTTTSTTTISLFGGILSLPLSPIANVWALNVTGTEGPDTLTGTAEKDTIRGYGGADMISGLEGNDQIRSDGGDDTIHGNDGRDRIRGDRGNDVIFGNDGNDMLIAGPGNDSLTGGPGKDTFNCGEGIDTVMDFDPVINDTVMASCENTNPLSTADEDAAINISSNLPEEQAADDIPINPFNISLLEEENGESKMIANTMMTMAMMKREE